MQQQQIEIIRIAADAFVGLDELQMSVVLSRLLHTDMQAERERIKKETTRGTRREHVVSSAHFLDVSVAPLFQ